MHAVSWIEGTISLILLATGLALRNCVFLGAAALLGISGFYRYMDSFQPGKPMRAALRCISAGTASIAIALIMALVVITGTFGFWPPIDPIALVAGGLLGTIAMIIRDVISEYRSAVSALLPMELLIVVAAALALGLAANGIEWTTCFFAGAAFAVTGLVGWRLAGETASVLLRSGAER